MYPLIADAKKTSKLHFATLRILEVELLLYPFLYILEYNFDLPVAASFSLKMINLSNSVPVVILKLHLRSMKLARSMR